MSYGCLIVLILIIKKQEVSNFHLISQKMVRTRSASSLLALQKQADSATIEDHQKDDKAFRMNVTFKDKGIYCNAATR